MYSRLYLPHIKNNCLENVQKQLTTNVIYIVENNSEIVETNVHLRVHWLLLKLQTKHSNEGLVSKCIPIKL